DVLADQAAQQVRQLGQDVRDVDDARLQGLLAREGEQLAHQVGGAVGILLDLHDVGEGLVAGAVAHQQQVAEADHGGQQVVEVVGDAAGELADRLHLLRLGELHLELLALGDVDEVGAPDRDPYSLALRSPCWRFSRTWSGAPFSRPAMTASSRLLTLGRSCSAMNSRSWWPIRPWASPATMERRAVLHSSRRPLWSMRAMPTGASSKKR